MVRTISVGAAGLSVFLSVSIAADAAMAAKDQSRIDSTGTITKPDISGPLLSPGLGTQNPGFDDDSVQDTPDADGDRFAPIQTIELSEEVARRALDALLDLRLKYANEGMLEYETLEAFIRETEAGKRMEADLAEYGFESAADWNSAVLSIDFAYGAIIDGDAADIQAQIEEVRTDRNLSEADRKAMIDGLNAMLSTPGNKKIVRDLLKDATYSVKLKQLDEME